MVLAWGSIIDSLLTVWLSLNRHALGLFHVTLSDAIHTKMSQRSPFWCAALGLSDKFIKLSTKWASTALMSFSLLDNG